MKSKIDISTIIGGVLGTALVIFGILFGTDLATKKLALDLTAFISFLDAQSAAITIGGTFGMLMVCFPLQQLAKIPKHMKIMFLPPQYNPEDFIEILVECAKKARINGLLALEEDINNMGDPFLKSSLMMVVDSVDPEKVKTQLSAQLDYLEERHSQDRSLYDRGAALAPAFGMLGTLVGLIKMMRTLDDPASVGPNMAVALVTTFYGSILANMFFMPISCKLGVRHQEEYTCRMIICEGVQAIQEGENPKFIQTRLVQMLPVYRQKKLGLGAEEGEGKGDGKKEKKAKKEK